MAELVYVCDRTFMAYLRIREVRPRVLSYNGNLARAVGPSVVVHQLTREARERRQVEFVPLDLGGVLPCAFVNDRGDMDAGRVDTVIAAMDRLRRSDKLGDAACISSADAASIPLGVGTVSVLPQFAPFGVSATEEVALDRLPPARVAGMWRELAYGIRPIRDFLGMAHTWVEATWNERVDPGRFVVAGWSSPLFGPDPELFGPWSLETDGGVLEPMETVSPLTARVSDAALRASRKLGLRGWWSIALANSSRGILVTDAACHIAGQGGAIASMMSTAAGVNPVDIFIRES